MASPSILAPLCSLLPERPRSLTLAALLLMTACAESAAPEVFSHELAEGTIGGQQNALTGRLDTVAEAGSGDQVCTPFAVQRIDRALTMSSAVLNSPAFESCVRERARRYHIACSYDPNWQEGIDTQVDRLFSGLRGGNHVSAVCSTKVNQDSAHEQAGIYASPLGADDTKEWGMRRHWTLAHWDGETASGAWGMTAASPINYDLAGVLHEYAHTHGFDHAGPDCYTTPGACDQEQCEWTRACGGSGVPPATPWAWHSPDARNRCAVEAGFEDDEYINGDGDPSFPYIITDCAYQLAEESATECPDGLLPSTCEPDELQLLSSWNDTARSYEGACGCRPSARHEVAFRTGSGHFLQAVNAGGEALTAQGTGLGPWQTFFLVDENGGYLQHNDIVKMRTYRNDAERGFFVGAGATAGSVANASFDRDESQLVRFRIRRVAGTGRVRNGDSVSLLNLGRSRFLTAVNNGGGDVVSDATVNNIWERFTYVEPRRAMLVNVRTHDGRYVSFDPAGTGTDLVTAPFAADVTGDNAQRAARLQSFWVIDHNGGTLMHNDVVSFESSLDMQHWSTCTSGTTDNVRGNAVYQSSECQRFRIQRVAGTGRVLHGDGIRIVSMGQGRFLNAVPDGQPLRFRLRNDATVASSWERFELELAAGRDGSDAGSARDAARFDVR